MSDIANVIDRYFAFWNETDPARRRDLMTQAFTEDASQTGPLLAAEGHEGIETLAQNIKEHLPGHTFRRIGEIEAHHGRVRLSWEVLPPEGAPRFAAGTDFGVLAADGRLQTVTTFLDQAPVQAGGHP